MSILSCLRTKISTGRVDARAGAQLLDWIDELRIEREGRETAAEAARSAAIEVADQAAIVAARQSDLALRSIEAQINVLDAVSRYRTSVDALAIGDADSRPLTLRRGVVPTRVGDAGAPSIGPAIRALLARDPHEIATGANVHYLARDIRGRAHGLFAEAIEVLRPKALGLKAEAAAELDTLRALFGAGDVPAAARMAADAWTRTAEDLRKQFNAAGGDIPQRKNWHLPQSHDASKVAAATRDSWKEFVRPLLDRDDMLDFATGLKLSDARLEGLLDQVYETIASRGISGPPSMAGGGRPMLANARAEQRVLSFRDADAWMAYKERFGPAGGIFEIQMRHIGDMADDIAQMRVLGPNPAGMRRFVEGLFDREAAALRGNADAGDQKAVVGAVKDIRRAEAGLRREKQATLNLWDEITGASRVPVDMELARSMGDMRTVLMGAQMGSAIISSISDQATLAMASRLNGLSAMNVVKSAVRMMADRTSEITAAQAGLIADTLAVQGHEADRYMGETIRSGMAAKVTGAVIRASGLRVWTQSLRNAFGMEMMAHAAHLSDTPFGQLPARFREAFGRYGISADNWDVIRSAEIWEPRPGARFLRPADVAALGGEEAATLSERLARMVNTEMDHAVIDTDPTTRTLLFQGTKPGTGTGELLRATGMYKQFPVTFITLHFARAFARGWDGTRLAHGAMTLGALWGFGILAMQAKQIAAGRDPYSLDLTTAQGARAWGAGLLQSGGLGIFGDMLGQDKTKYGNSWASTLAGPQFAAAEAVLGQFLLGNLGRAVKGEPTHFAGDALYTASRFLPGSSLWYGRLAFQRGVIDQLALMADPRAPDRFRRMETEADRTWSQQYWWRPGQTAPARAPAIGGGF